MGDILGIVKDQKTELLAWTLRSTLINSGLHGNSCLAPTPSQAAAACLAQPLRVRLAPRHPSCQHRRTEVQCTCGDSYIRANQSSQYHLINHVCTKINQSAASRVIVADVPRSITAQPPILFQPPADPILLIPLLFLGHDIALQGVAPPSR